MQIERHGRYWKVMDGNDLVCICLYKKGAIEVIHRLTAQEGVMNDEKQAADY